jgi:mRNA-degrading endonuclease RelE of RelBE toxin-antitoxin system
MASVVLAEPAAAFLKLLDSDVRFTIIHKLHDLETDPERRGKALSGDLAAYRSIHAAGRYRIIYRTEGEQVDIVAIGLRKDGDRDDVYAALKRSLSRHM